MLNSLVGRQPVIDINTYTFGYELFFLEGTEKLFTKLNREMEDELDNKEVLATQIDKISGKKKVFINFTEKLLKEGYWSILPKERVIIELLSSVKPGVDIEEICRTIKQEGFTIALKNFKYDSKWDPIIEIVDIIKIDIKETSVKEIEAFSKKFYENRISLLAENVDTLQDYYWVRKLGFKYFQGYYFSKPEIIKSEQVPTSRLTKLRLIHEVNKTDFEYNEVETLIKHDPGLTINLLKYVNSAAMGVRNEIIGISHAFSMIGQNNLRKWISILAVSAFTEKKPRELMQTIVKRGQFCELLAPQFGFQDKEAQSLFLIGMFSLLDAIIDMPLEKVLLEIPLSNEIKNTILGQKTPFTDILELAITFESCDWIKMQYIIKEHSLIDRTIIENHVKAIEWTENFVD